MSCISQWLLREQHCAGQTLASVASRLTEGAEDDEGECISEHPFKDTTDDHEKASKEEVDSTVDYVLEMGGSTTRRMYLHIRSTAATRASPAQKHMAEGSQGENETNESPLTSQLRFCSFRMGEFAGHTVELGYQMSVSNPYGRDSWEKGRSSRTALAKLKGCQQYESS